MLAPVAKGPYRVKSMDNRSKTVVIEYNDQMVEEMPQSRVVLAPGKMSLEVVQDGVCPSQVYETILDYPAPENINQRHAGNDIQAEHDAKRENNSSKWADNFDDTSASDVTADETQTEPNEFPIQVIIGHRINHSKRHRYANYGDWLHRVR